MIRLDVIDDLRTHRATPGDVRVVVHPLAAAAASFDLERGQVSVGVVAGRRLPELDPLSEGTADVERLVLADDDLAGALRLLVNDGGSPPLVGGLVHARPLATLVARCDPSRVVLVACPMDGEPSADALVTAGILLRVLLDEVSDDTRLGDLAGIVLGAAGSYPAPADAWATSIRARRLVATHPHIGRDLVVASEVDVAGAVPSARRADDGTIELVRDSR